MKRLVTLGCGALAALAGVAELVAVQAAIAGALRAALLLHAVAALLVGCCMLSTLWQAGRADAGAALGASLLALCAPAVGPIAVIAIGLPAARRGLARRPSARRVAATRALARDESARAVPRLRRALRDPSEDVRVLAHAILERREQQLRGVIETLREALARLDAHATDVRARARLHAQLADHYWELCEAGFAAGEGAVQALRRAAEHAEAAAAAPTTRCASLVAVRAYLRLGALKDAAAAIERAAHAGLSSMQLAPLRAELAFLTRRFGRVGAELTALSPLSLQRAQLGEIARFWSERGRG